MAERWSWSWVWLVLAVAVAAAMSAGSSAAHATSLIQGHVYDDQVRTYDLSANLAPETVADARGSGAAEWTAAGASGSSLAFSSGLVAPRATGFAEDGARFVVDSAGSATVRARGPQGWVDLSPHAAQRLTERGISLGAVDDALRMQPFNYFHDGIWKVGYYDSASRVFVGTVNGTATTVIRTGPGYISNLQAATP